MNIYEYLEHYVSIWSNERFDRVHVYVTPTSEKQKDKLAYYSKYPRYELVDGEFVNNGNIKLEPNDEKAMLRMLNLNKHRILELWIGYHGYQR